MKLIPIGSAQCEKGQTNSLKQISFHMRSKQLSDSNATTCALWTGTGSRTKEEAASEETYIKETKTGLKSGLLFF